MPMETPDAATRDAQVSESGGTAAAPDSSMLLPDAALPPCEAVAPTACPEPMPTYTADILPIIETHCLSCHHGKDPNGPWPLTTYGHVADWHDIIRAAMLNCSMPPAEAPVPMTTAERQTVLDWLRCGYPR